MRVRVLFFGRLKDIVGRAEERAELSEGARVEDLFERYGKSFPELAKFRASIAASVNQEFAEWRAPLAAGDEKWRFFRLSAAGRIPPGQRSRKTCASWCVRRSRHRKLWHSSRLRPTAPWSCFEGIVRDHSGGRSTLCLEYEAYEAMALAKMREIGGEMRDKFQIRRYAMIHRLGRLEIGETSVLIVVCSAHRAAAFDACRYGIDTLKRNVPIWKKEFFSDGAVWA